MELIIPLLIGFVLDAFIGDPYSLPHPIRTFGNAINFGEKKLNHSTQRKLKGAILTIILVVAVYCIFFALVHLLHMNNYAYYIGASVMVFYGLANHMLIKEGLKVNSELEKNGLEAGRKRLSYIVGRDTTNLTPQEIRTAILETLAENLSDGVIAPLFYYAIGGVPAMFAYKMINTLDSMIGYKSDRYKDFGYFAAKLDDVFNFIPARLTSILMVILTFNLKALSFIFKYGNKHSSPNAGYPEAALAGILNCRFGGPNVYHGKLVDKPYIGSDGRDVSSSDIIKAAWVNVGVSILMVIGNMSLLYLL